MSAPNPFRTPSLGQLVAVLAATMALFFMISFVGKVRASPPAQVAERSAWFRSNSNS